MTHSWHSEPHFIERNNWLRAAVLGANDGLISTASLLIGMVAAAATKDTLILAGTAALVAGAVSMAAGEFVSVSSQSDIEQADLDAERKLLDEHPEKEHEELTQIYIKRGLDEALAAQVAHALMAHDDLDAHARDELGITDTSTAKPLEAAAASAISFAIGAVLPVLVVFLLPVSVLYAALFVATLFGLMLLGYVSAHLGGSSKSKSVVRILLWGVAALVATTVIGKAFGVTVG